jgi:hypothetical protein
MVASRTVPVLPDGAVAAGRPVLQILPEFD